MKHLFPFLLALFLLPGIASAQECRCCNKRAEGQRLFDKKRYEEAIEKWKYAAELSDPEGKCTDIPALIKKARQRISARNAAAAKVASFLVKIPGGTFAMGDQFGDGSSDELPVHNVTLSDFYLSKYEVSFEEYDAFCSATRQKKISRNRGIYSRPPIKVDWYDCIEYCNWLSVKHDLRAVYSIDKVNKDPDNKNSNDSKKWTVKPDWSANGYRLPTEAEWEYAARTVTNAGKVQGGGKVRFGNGRDIIDPSEINFNAKSDYKQPYSVVGQYRQQTIPVDALSANGFGLKNMSGNVWEWCWDWYDDAMYKNSEGARDPKGSDSGKYRVMRGGSWLYYPEYCRSSNRDYDWPNNRNYGFGFRVARRL